MWGRAEKRDEQVEALFTITRAFLATLPEELGPFITFASPVGFPVIDLRPTDYNIDIVVGTFGLLVSVGCPACPQRLHRSYKTVACCESCGWAPGVVDPQPNRRARPASARMESEYGPLGWSTYSVSTLLRDVLTFPLSDSSHSWATYQMILLESKLQDLCEAWDGWAGEHFTPEE